MAPLRTEVKLNSIDEITTELLVNAEKGRKFRTGEVDYSTEITKAVRNWYFWRLLLKHKFHERNRFGTLLSLSAEPDIEYFTLCL